MGFFGNDAKKTLQINRTNKEAILQKLNNIDCSNSSTNRAITSLSRLLSDQADSESKEVLAIDAKIMHYLQKVIPFIEKKRFSTALITLFDVEDLIVERKTHCKAGGRKSKKQEKKDKKANKSLLAAMDKLEEDDDLQNDVDALDAELARYKEREKILLELHKEFPEDASIVTQINTNTAKANATASKLQAASQGTVLTTQHAGAKDIADYVNTVTDRTVSEAEVNVTLGNLEESQKTVAAMAEASAKMGAALANGAANTFNTSAFQTMGATNTAFTTIGATNAAATTIGGTMGTQVQAQYGTFNASEVGSTAMANDIKRTLQALERSLDQLDEKIEDANDELNDYNAELRPLLTRRQTASPSDCLVLDGQIDQINAKRNSVIYKIKRLRQTQAKLNDQRSLMEKLNTQQDITATNAQIEQLTGGKFADLAGLSMFLNDSVKQSNEELEEIGAAISVAENEEIMMNSASAGAAILTDVGTISKDEDKYLALQQELGMPMM